MPNQNLADLCSLSQTNEHLVLTIVKTTAPAKKFALKEVAKNKDGTAIYEVPKSEIYAYFARDLADGSVITMMRRKEVSYSRRLELFNAGVAAGLDVRPIGDEKAKKKSDGLTLENLIGANFKPTGDGKKGKKDSVTNSL